MYRETLETSHSLHTSNRSAVVTASISVASVGPHFAFRGRFRRRSCAIVVVCLMHAPPTTGITGTFVLLFVGSKSSVTKFCMLNDSNSIIANFYCVWTISKYLSAVTINVCWASIFRILSSGSCIFGCKSFKTRCFSIGFTNLSCVGDTKFNKFGVDSIQYVSFLFKIRFCRCTIVFDK